MSQVVIDDIIPRTQLIATAGQTVFNTNWTVNATTDVLVYARADGVEADDATQLVSASDYNVTLVGGSETVRVTFLSGRTLNDIITIVRNTPTERLNLYVNTNFVPSMLNEDFGILTLVDQQAQMYDTVVAPHYNVSAIIEPDSVIGGGDVILPILPAGYGWRKNSAGTAIEAIEIPDGGFAPKVGSFVTVSDERADLPNSFPLFDLGNASTGGMGIPAGTTAQRVVPSAPNIGLRFNTDLGFIEAYIGGNWVEIPSSASGLFLPLAGGTMSGAINMDGNFINNLINPINNQDAATKNYVDSVVGGAVGGVSGNIQWNDGGTFGGDPNFNTDGAGNVTIDGSLEVDNLSFNGNRISATTGLVELEDAQLFNDLDADSNKIVNLLAPSNATDAANKAYVDSIAAGFFFLEPVIAASTANFTSTYNNGTAGVGATLTASSNGAASIDGVSLALNDRVLFKNQTNTFENGIYTVTQVGDGSNPAIYTRALDYDEPSDIDPGDMVPVIQGTENASTLWLETDVVTTIGTDPIVFIQFGVAANNIVTITGSQTITGQKTFVAPILGSASATSISFTSTSGIIGTTTNDNAAAGSVGEIISSEILIGSAVSATSNNPTNVTSISLTPGDWDVFGTVWTSMPGATTTNLSTWISTTSATSPTAPNAGKRILCGQVAVAAGSAIGQSAGYGRLSLSSTTTVYLSAVVVYTGGTGSLYGYIGARRVR
jgi:hypothetical protein